MRSRRRREQSKWLHRGRLRDVVVVLCVASAFRFSVSTATFCAGLALLAVGCALHVVVKGQLVRNVILCTEGAYAIVRHPYYLANYLIDVSFCLLSGNVFLLLLYPFLFFWAYGSTLREEESRLASLHGGDFDAYQARVPQVFPNATVFARLRTLGKGFSWRRVSWGEIKRLFRFGFVATLLALLQQVGPEGWKELLVGRSPLDRGGLVLLALSTALFLASASIPRRGEEVGRSGDSRTGA
ncbi:MAG TPA: isoprenylcysteine carboxylmethyltransferase family protein [Thermoguttaceae bacterium]|nr:isoprenylcysteine carboxylmethyltransferase family protein [Thermoguttaceae bacterium]